MIKAAAFQNAKAEAKSKSKKQSKEEMEQNDENPDNPKKRRRRSGDMKQNSPPKQAQETCANKERQQANRQTAAPAFPAETGKTKTSVRAPPLSVSSATAGSDPKGEPRPRKRSFKP